MLPALDDQPAGVRVASVLAAGRTQQRHDAFPFPIVQPVGMIEQHYLFVSPEQGAQAGGRCCLGDWDSVRQPKRDTVIESRAARCRHHDRSRHRRLHGHVTLKRDRVEGAARHDGGVDPCSLGLEGFCGPGPVLASQCAIVERRDAGRL
jgi:hypothetical protein